MTNEFNTVSTQEIEDAEKTATLVDAVQYEHHTKTSSPSTFVHTVHLLHGLDPKSHTPTQKFLTRAQHSAKTLFPTPSFFERHRISFYALFGTTAAACAWSILVLTQQNPLSSTQTNPALSVEQTNNTTSPHTNQNTTEISSSALAVLQNEITDIESLIDGINDDTQDIVSLETSISVLSNIDDLNARSTTLFNELSTL